MERLLYLFREQKQPKLNYIQELEAQANRFVEALTFGGNKDKLLDAGDKGILVYHHGPEMRVRPGFPTATDIPTGKEYVFIEFHHTEASYQFVGNVNEAKQFTLLRLDRYQEGKGYRQVKMIKHQEVFRRVTEILRETEPPLTEGG